MSYTKKDVTDLRDALLAAKLGKLRTHEAVMAVFDCDFETARTAEAVAMLHEAHETIEAAVKLLDDDYDRISAEVAREEAGSEVPR